MPRAISLHTPVAPPSWRRHSEPRRFWLVLFGASVLLHGLAIAIARWQTLTTDSAASRQATRTPPVTVELLEPLPADTSVAVAPTNSAPATDGSAFLPEAQSPLTLPDSTPSVPAEPVPSPIPTLSPTPIPSPTPTPLPTPTPSPSPSPPAPYPGPAAPDPTPAPPREGARVTLLRADPPPRDVKQQPARVADTNFTKTLETVLLPAGMEESLTLRAEVTIDEQGQLGEVTLLNEEVLPQIPGLETDYRSFTLNMLERWTFEAASDRGVPVASSLIIELEVRPR